MADRSSDFKTPFLTIWIRPRATIRRIIASDPTRHVLLLAATRSALTTVNVQKSIEAMALSSPHPHPLEWYFRASFVNWLVALWSRAGILASRPTQIMVLLVMGAAFGIVWLYVAGTILKWTGRLFRGTGSSLEVRAAIAWGQIPFIIGTVFFLFAFRFGSSAPCSNCGFRFLLTLGGAVLIVWGFVSLTKCIAEVHRFSAWRGLGAVVLSLWILVAAQNTIVFSLLYVRTQLGL
jgi:hypothetical protein